MKLRTLLYTSFAAIGICVALFGAFALRSIDQVNDRLVAIADSWLPSVKAVGEVNSVGAEVRRLELLHIATTDAAGMATVEQRVDEALKRFAAVQAAYEPLISSDEERALEEQARGMVQAVAVFRLDEAAAARRGAWQAAA